MKNINAKRNELLRAINELEPSLYEGLMSYWGTRLLPIIAAEFLSELKVKYGNYSGNLGDLVIALLALHESEFEGLTSATEGSIRDGLSSSPQFIIVNHQLPHIGKRLSATWATKYFSIYTNILAAQGSGFKRFGFPSDVMVAIFTLKQEHDLKYPELVVGRDGLQWY